MKVALTGISGQLGQTCLHLLEEDPDIESVIGIDIKKPPPSPKMRFAERDIRDPEIEKDLTGCDALVHLAFVVMSTIADETETDSINIGGTKNVLESAATAGIKNIVYSSSVSAYGSWPDNPVPIKEDWPTRPTPGFYYARAKATIENWLDDVFEKEHPDIKVVRLRSCTFLGPGVDNLMSDKVQAKRLFLIKGLNLPIQYLWDEDVARAIHLGLKSDVCGAFNIASDDFVTPEEEAELLGKLTIVLPYWLARFTMTLLSRLRVKNIHPGWIEGRFPIVVDSSKAKVELGWKPSRTSRETILEFARSIKN